MTKITPVILSGGAGTRLWPLSHDNQPKQLLPLLGSERTLLQETALRTADSSRFAAPVIVASSRHGDETAQQLASVGVRPSQTILEPSGRNTAAAITLAALRAEPKDLLLVTPSDHAILDASRFLDHVWAAVPLARRTLLVTFGITPLRPETGYGYIEIGEPLDAGQFYAKRFVEKPDGATAARYVDSGKFLWNAGIFMFEAQTYLGAIEQYAPNVLAAVRASLAGVTLGEDYLHPDPVAFGGVPSLSVDVAVFERSDAVAVVPVDIGWSDVGSWDALYELGAKDNDGNVLNGQVTSLGSRNCLLRTEGPKVVAIDVEDLVIVATEHAVLVVPRGNTQRVRDAVQRVLAMT
jgi:mannose-1-phosphate guanylyltransferase/mannose-1-phosphate guanylyltransferase/mannose-6-phosphate isomerase